MLNCLSKTEKVNYQRKYFLVFQIPDIYNNLIISTINISISYVNT